MKFGRKILLSIFINDSEAKIKNLIDEEIEFYEECIGEKYPHYCNVWRAMDGLKVTIQKPCHESIQNRFYNGWTHGHYVNCLFIFALDGRIRTTVYKVPGTFNDSAMADYGVYATI